jgi:protoporphyrinogen/coproporphyrinogen III oxidase
VTDAARVASTDDGLSQHTHHEVIVVGGGIAGLVAGWSLRDRDVVVLEADTRPGGRALSASRGPYWVNLGAHTIALTDGLLAEYARDLHVPVVVPRGSLLAVGMRSRLIRAGRPETLPLRLPLDSAARASLVRVGLRLRRAFITVSRAERRGAGPQASIDRMMVDARLDDMAFSDVLGHMHPDVEALMRVTANRMGTELDRVSGHRGVWNALGVWGSRRANVVGGTEALTDALATSLGDRLRTGISVRRISQTQELVSVEGEGQGHPLHLTADRCIIAVPAPAVLEIVAGLPDEKDAALRKIPYGPYVVAGIFTSETRPMPWDNIYAAAVPSRAFSMFFNSANPMRSGLRRAGGSLVVYAAGDPASELMACSDASITERFLNDLYEAVPQTKGVVREVIVKRWPVGIPVSTPGRARLQPQVAAPHGRLFFAGDYIAEPGLDSAAWTAEVAAQAVRSAIAGSEA